MCVGVVVKIITIKLHLFYEKKENPKQFNLIIIDMTKNLMIKAMYVVAISKPYLIWINVVLLTYLFYLDKELTVTKLKILIVNKII